MTARGRKVKNQAKLDDNYVIPVLKPRTKEAAKKMERVLCPTCEGTGRLGNKPCGLCADTETPGVIWATK